MCIDLYIYTGKNVYLNLLRIFKELLALGDELTDNGSLGFKLAKRLLLPLNQLLDIFNAARCDISGGAEHDAIKEFNVRLKLITVCITFPVQVNLDLGLEDGGNELFVFLDESIELGDLETIF